ncbi:MAG: methylmalonyl-CoA mutase small subunit [Bacteroidaceae bacterium]|nr:methylmalonyl-CoA mutase small subunit [Bacteroidaceae bacterium]
MAEEKQKLFSEFPPITTEEWMNKITEDLKGADFQKRLVWKTTEGFDLQPFYRKEDVAEETKNELPGVFPFTRGCKQDNNWLIRQEIKEDDALLANQKAKLLLEKGCTSLGLSIKGSLVSATYINTMLEGIDAEKTELNFKTCIKKAYEFTALLIEYYKERNFNFKKLRGSIEYDPIGKQLTKGRQATDSFDTMIKLADLTAALPNYRCFVVNAALLCNSGAYTTHELGYALAWGNEYMNILTEAGIPASAAAKKIKFNFGISSNFFMEIAKIRAARMLWANIVKEYGPNSDDDCKMAIHAVTSTFNQTLYDPYVNILRGETEAMSAALAGVGSITVTPFDAVYETPTAFAERIARNQQLILKNESHLDRVTDPAAGSYFIEKLTATLAGEAWKLFLATEEEGGFCQAVNNGTVQNSINNDSNNRRTAAARRKEILLGTNQYPNFNETTGGNRPLDKQCCCGTKEEPGANILSSKRLAEDFEALRMQVENSGKRPKVFMLTIGNLAMRQARAQFSSNFFAVAGYEIIDNLGFSTVDEGVDAAIKASADIVVICSSDDEYAEYAIPAYKKLKDKVLFVVAGAPACSDELKNAGIENFIHVRVNVLETLKDINAKL